MSSRHGVGHLPCHTVSDLIECKLLFSVLCLFTAPEGLTWCPGGIYNPSQRNIRRIYFFIAIQRQGIGLKEEGKFGGERYPRSLSQGQGSK